MKNSFIAGAAVLMAANAISKILGAVFKIPLTYIVHEEGMAVYNTAFGVYVMFLAFIVSGIPFAVQRLTAAAYARKEPETAKRIVGVSTLILALVGAAGSIILWFGAEFFALAMKEERAVWAIRALSPSVFFVACGASVKSGFQGRSDMVPTALSQVIEAVIKLAAGYALAVFFIYMGTGYAAAGAAAGVTIGELSATFILAIWYIKSFGRIKGGMNIRATARSVMDTAMPVMLMAVTSSFLSVCDTSLLRKSLLTAGFSAEEARFLYGSYTGYAMTVLNLPAGLLATVGVSIIPIAAGAAETGDMRRIQKAAERGLSLVCGAGALSFMLLYFYGGDALHILFGNENSAEMLKVASPSVLFICVMQLSGAILQAMGYMNRVFLSSLTVGIIKLALTVILASVPEINIYGAALASDVAFFTGALLNMIFVSRSTGLKREFTGIIIKPAASAAAGAFIASLMQAYKMSGAWSFQRTAVTVFVVSLSFAAVFFLLGGHKSGNDT